MKSFLTIFAAAVLVHYVAAQQCRGTAMYKVVFSNILTPENFEFIPDFPEDGVNYSPLAGVAHSSRISFLTIRGFASPQVEQIAETGMNGRFLKNAEHLLGKGVKTVEGGMGAGPGMNQSVVLMVDCENPFITALSMVAPSPDWIVQVNNKDTVDEDGSFIPRIAGSLIAYDAGTDDGDMFTAPADASLDLPTEPPKNIAPLVEDPTDPFGGAVIGFYVIERID
ncbi:Spondin [Gracilaria domingensis]|nr:Spondin [Gracilaria domingensis]